MIWGTIGWHQDAGRHKWKARPELNRGVKKKNERKKGGREGGREGTGQEGAGRESGDKEMNEARGKDGTGGRGRARGPGIRRRMKEETELAVELRNDGSGLLVQYPRIKGRRGRPGPETLLQQLPWPLGRALRVARTVEASDLRAGRSENRIK